MEKSLITELNEFLDFSSSKKNDILNNLININSNLYTFNKENYVDITDNIYKDTNIDKFAENLPILEGSKILINKIIKNPINNKELLENRQNSYIPDNINFDILKEYEKDVLWVFKLNTEINNNASIKIFFPSEYIISYINYISPILDFFHFYKIYLIPISSLLFPLTTFFAPLYYLNKYMKLNLTITKYISLLINILKIFTKSSGSFKIDIIKIISFILYLSIYIYNIYQSFQYSYMLYETKKTLHSKMNGLVIFIKESLNIIKNIPKNIIKPYININETDIIDININIKNSMSDIYKLWKNDKLKNKINYILINIYCIDIINSISRLKDLPNWCNCNYVNDNTKIWDQKNPLLSNTQSCNPVDLSKNIIITGPNAAGKTTYVKSILSNVILSQTFGITNSLKSHMIIYDTLYSFMRVSDILGSKSYFEVEAEYCSKMIKKSEELVLLNKKGLFLMDEPMHSTPPIEGMATAFAVAEYIGNMTGINIIITTHFHKLVILEELYPNKFINLSVEALKEDNKFKFSYLIKKGYSYQCIAIDLLTDKDFPDILIDSAKKMKNIIYTDINSKIDK